jgi:hypothetical protein
MCHHRHKGEQLVYIREIIMVELVEEKADLAKSVVGLKSVAGTKRIRRNND